MTEQNPAVTDETMGKQLIDAAHDQDATPDQLAEAAGDLAEAAINDATPEKRAEVAEQITRRLAPLILAAGVDMESAIVSHKVARMQALGIPVDEERIRKVISLRRKPIRNQQ